MPAKPSPRVLLFDLGGVIVPWTGIEALAELTGLETLHIKHRLQSSDIIKAYEIGGCGDDTFAQEMITVFKLNMTREAFKLSWRHWVKAPYPETEAVLAKLRPKYSLASLSNTNTLHWAGLGYLEDMLDSCMASHIFKVAKPNSRIYALAHKVLDVSPKNIWFFDDTIENVDAATAYGMTAFHVDNTVGVVPTLRALGLV